MGQRKVTSVRMSSDAASNPTFFVPTAPLDWAILFGNSNPVEVEVGCGKGLFLLNAASQQPATNFLGIEIARKFALFTADRVARRGLTNVRVACADARRVLAEWIADASVSVLHVYFPDPWWKRRHKKRRVFTDRFVHHAARVLLVGGELRVASDVDEYFEVMCSLVDASDHFVIHERPPAREPEHDLDYLSNFERKYRKAGKPIFRAVFCRAG